MSFRLTLDSGSVVGAARSVRAVGSGLDAAPGGAALRLVAAAVPGGELSRAAATEAAEWAGEMARIAAVFERYSAQLEAAVAALQRTDRAGAAALRR